MFLQRVCTPAVLFATLIFGSPTHGWADDGQPPKIAKLLESSPLPANAIGYLNVPALNRVTGNAGFAAPGADSLEEIWFISELNFAEFRPTWEVGYAILKRPVNAEMLANRVGGYTDTVEDQTVVHSPEQTYLIPIKDQPKRIGLLRPTNRQLLARWISPNIEVSYLPFLTELADQPESYLSFMMAVELDNLLSPTPLAKRITKLEALGNNSPESVARILASVNGFSVIVGRESLQQCIVKFYFDRSPASLKLIASDLLAELLENSGLAAPEIRSAEVTIEGNVLAFKGPITRSTLSGLIGIFSMQSQAERIAERASFSEDQSQQIAYRSKYYFDQVNEIIEQTRDYKSPTAGAMAKWNDKRARQIDELSTRNIDPEMVQYGSNVASLLRGNALTVRQTNIQAGTTKAGQSLDRGYYSDASGYYNSNSTADYQRVTDAMARGAAYGDYRVTLNQIDQLTADTRRSMAAKYNLDF